MGAENSSQFPPIKDRLARVRDLSKKLGGVDNIPDEALVEIGYRRVEEGHLVPLEKTVFQPLEGKVEVKKAPFAPIDISLPATESTYRDIRGNEIVSVDKQIQKLSDEDPIADGGDTTNNIIHYYADRIPAHHPIHEFIREFYKSQTIDDLSKTVSPHEIFFDWTAAHVMNERLEADNIQDRGILADYTTQGVHSFFESLRQLKDGNQAHSPQKKIYYSFSWTTQPAYQ